MNQTKIPNFFHSSSPRRRKTRKRDDKLRTFTRRDGEDQPQSLPFTGNRTSPISAKSNEHLLQSFRRSSFGVVFILGITTTLSLLLASQKDSTHFDLDSSSSYSNRNMMCSILIRWILNDECRKQHMSSESKRIVFYSSPHEMFDIVKNRTVSPMTQTPKIELKHEFVRDKKDCVPMQEWQKHSFPVCNQVHEMDMNEGLKTSSFSLIGKGWFRSTWKVDTAHNSFVLKMLRSDCNNLCFLFVF